MKKGFKILVVTRFNNGEAYYINKPINLKFKRHSPTLIIGEDWPFYKVYYKMEPDPNFKAFGGRSFTLTMEDGEAVDCCGQWWEGRYYALEKLKNIEVVPVKVSYWEHLPEPLVEYHADKAAIIKMREAYTGIVFEPLDIGEWCREVNKR